MKDILAFLIIILLCGFLTYGIIGAIAEHDQAYNLTNIKPVKIYEYCENNKLCEVK